MPSGRHGASAQGTNGPSKAWQMLSMLKTNYPTKFVAHEPYMYINFHSSFPYKEFGYWCDAVMPQAYWESFGITPEQAVTDLNTQWRNWHAGLSGIWTNAIKPIAPIGQADNTNILASEITAFVNSLVTSTNPPNAGGYKGVSWWRADLHTTNQWPAIGAASIGTPTGIPDLIVDNTAATVVGTWSTGTSSNDKYGIDYRNKGQGTGTAYLQFIPNIPAAGNYKTFVWYPAGSNRTTNAPITIVHAAGTTTAVLNQKANGGSWRYMGTFPYDVGTSAWIKVADNIPDAGQLVMADAVMYQYVMPPPDAPNGLTATAVSGPAINLTWTDNSTNEVNFMVARSQFPGGPYSDIGSTVAGVTSFSDRQMAANATYFYVVRAINESGASANSNEAAATAPDEVADIIIDNPAATPTGTWTVNSSATDKFGSDYRVKSQGNGTSFFTYTPNILTPGDYAVYEWHPEGSNRTLGAPYTITFNGGSQTINANQQVNGGQWNFLGSFNFVAGTSGGVKLSDAFADSTNLVMADAIRFSYVPVVFPPAAPGNLTATPVSATQISLAWTDNSTNEIQFVVSRSSTAGGPYTDIAILPANVNAYSSTGLSALTTYYFVVRAENGGGDSPNSAEASATTLPFPPAAPSGLTATPVSASQINLGWTDNSTNENNFIIGRSITSGGPYTDVGAAPANATSFTDSGLITSTTYYYVVRAGNAGGSSANTAQATATTMPPAPAAPSELTATAISQSEINLTWTDNSSNETSFTIARSTTSGGPYVDVATTLTANMTSYSDGSLADDTTYYYVVRANNGSGSSTNSLEATAATLPFPPSAPSGLGATTISQTQINLGWTDNSTNEDNFVISRSTSSGGPYTAIATVGANTISFSDAGLLANTSYYYVVRAVNEGGQSANSTEVNATTLPTPPIAPSELTATALSSSQVALQWMDNSWNEENFIVERSTIHGGPYTPIVSLSVDTTSFTDGGLSPNTTYYFVVRASSIGGSSAYSAEAGATTYPPPPAAPGGLTATAISQTQINLAWTDNSSTEANFIVARSSSVGGPYTDIATLPANTTSYSNTGLAGGVTYCYVVRAVNIGGPSANSAEACAMTLPYAPAAPNSLMAMAVRATQINLAWVDAANNESNFIVGRSTTSGGPYTDIATLPANTTTYENTGLATNTTYYYVVRASNAGGVSANSAQASTTTFVTDLLVDNKSAQVVGAWSTATSATDKYGTDYRYKGQGNGSAFVQFTPYIAVYGVHKVYEWHSQGNDRETAVPHVVTYAGGSQTVLVSQKVKGGQWNLIGTFNFNAGSSGNIRITDGFATTKTAIADAIKLVYVPPPAAPSGLTANAAGSSSIILDWIDNATNEFNIVVSRSDNPNGPFNEVAILAANSTSYTDTGLTPNTQFFYVVFAQGEGGGSTNSNPAWAQTLPPPPAAPSGLAAAAVSLSQINLTWTDNATNEAYMIIGRSTVSGGPYTDISTLAANTTSFNDTGLAANTTYYYVVRATNAGGSSPISGQATATTYPFPPVAPSGLIGTAFSGSQINLAWTDNSSNEQNFIIGRSTVAGGPYTDIATVGANVTSSSDTGLSGGTTYYYVVRAANVGGSSANSAAASATTLATPSAPGGLTATAISSSQINLSWADNSSDEQGFVIARSMVSGGPYTDIGTVTANVTSFNNTGLAANMVYYYVVRATNSAGSSANSAQANATTFSSAPTPPSGLVATAVSSSQINLSWTDNSSNEDSFIIARSTVSGGPYTDIATLPANAVAFSDTGLAANTTYYYVVRAVNAGGASPNSNQFGATTLPNAPDAPGGLVATVLGSSSISLSWTDNSQNEANFIVARSTVSGGPFTDIATLGANVTTYTNTGLSANTTYYYVVRASNAGGSSTNSTQASATTLPLPPLPPSGLVATALTSTSIKLTWTDNSSDESGFTIGRSLTSGGPFTDIATVGANITTYTNTGLNGSTTYYYVVRANNAGGSSPNSTQASVTTLPVADLIIDNVSATVTGSWSTGTSSTDKFGTNYRFKGQGTGSAGLTFRPNILVAGNYAVYEWHPVGSNRTLAAPHIINYNGGTTTINVNQQINGGTWRLLGTFSFATGTTANVKITDAIPESTQSVMADAIKFVYVP